MASSSRDYLAQSAAIIAAAADDDTLLAALDRAVEACVGALEARSPILICGNGGSSADAMHIAAELVGRFKRSRRSINAVALGVNPAVSTAWSNDFDFDGLFAREVEAHGRPGGVLIAISTSGRSANVVAAARAARAAGMTVVAMTGAGGGDLAPLADVSLAPEVKDTPLVQQVHLCLYHLLCDAIERHVADRDEPR